MRSRKNKYIASPLPVFFIAGIVLLGCFLGAVAYLSYAFISARDAGGERENIIAKEKDLPDFKKSRQDEDRKSEWEIYENVREGFSFRYPKDWIVTRDLFSKNSGLVVTNRNFSNDVYGEIHIEYPEDNEKKTGDMLENNSADTDEVFSVETEFPRAGNNTENEFILFRYFEFDLGGSKISIKKWKYSKVYKKITESFQYLERGTNMFQSGT